MFEEVSLGAPENAVGFVMWRVMARYQREMDRALADYDLTNLQFITLALVAWFGREGEAVTQIELAGLAGIHPMQISQTLKALEAKKMVLRRTSHGQQGQTGCRYKAGNQQPARRAAQSDRRAAADLRRIGPPWGRPADPIAATRPQPSRRRDRRRLTDDCHGVRSNALEAPESSQNKQPGQTIREAAVINVNRSRVLWIRTQPMGEVSRDLFGFGSSHEREIAIRANQQQTL